jgi:structural maintenance of chromosome 1
LKEATEKEQEVEAIVCEARSVLKEAEEDCSKVNKALTNEESDLAKLRQKLHETLQKARVDEVDLPMVDGDVDMDEEAEDSQMSSSARSSKRRLSQHATQESSTHYSQRENSIVAKDRRDTGKVDFSGMEEELRKSLSAAEEDKLKKKFESKISKLTAEIECIAPNMKVCPTVLLVPHLLFTFFTNPSLHTFTFVGC